MASATPSHSNGGSLGWCRHFPVITMYVNNCPKHSIPGSCFARFLGRFSFQSLEQNPLLDPSSLTAPLYITSCSNISTCKSMEDMSGFLTKTIWLRACEHRERFGNKASLYISCLDRSHKTSAKFESDLCVSYLVLGGIYSILAISYLSRCFWCTIWLTRSHATGALNKLDNIFLISCWNPSTYGQFCSHWRIYL